MGDALSAGLRPRQKPAFKFISNHRESARTQGIPAQGEGQPGILRLKPPVQEEGPVGKRRLLTPLLLPVILIARHCLFANSNSFPPSLHQEV